MGAKSYADTKHKLRSDWLMRPMSRQLLQRTAVHTTADAVPPIVHEVLRSTGQPLDASARAFMEPHFGHDFSGVRVHTDAKAAESARAVHALAYTVGRDVVFGPGQYAPQSSAGQRLIAHELTHVAQQGAGAHTVSRGLAIGAADDRYEGEAAFATRAAMSGADVHNKFSLAQPMLQRAPDTPAPAQTEEKQKKPEIKITPATRTIPQSEAESQVPAAPVPTGLPDKSSSVTGAPAAAPKKEPEVEASVEGSAKERTVTTNVEVTIPIKPVGSAWIFGQPLVLGKELKAGVSIGPQQGPGGLWQAQQQAALKISLKALSYELESVKTRIPGMKELGLGVTGEATIDPARPLARPELGVKAGLEAEYQIGRTPIYLQGSIGYEVQLPSAGPATAAPTADFGFKIVLP